MLRHFAATREDITTRSSRSEVRKACIYLIKKHSSATNLEIAERFGPLTYSAVAKISESISKQLAVDKGLRERLKGFESTISNFKG